MIVSTTSLRLSPGFPAREIHSLDTRKALAKDALFLEWLAKQPRVIRLEVHGLVYNTL